MAVTIDIEQQRTRDLTWIFRVAIDLETNVLPAATTVTTPVVVTATGVAASAILLPIRFAATSYAIRVVTGGTTETLSFPALTVGRNYWTAGDAQADSSSRGGPGDLLTILQTTLNTNAAGRTYSVTASAAGYVTIAVDTGTFQILWANGATTLDETIFGWTLDTSTASTVTAPYQAQGWWAPGRRIAQDSREQQEIVGTMMTAVSGLERTARLATPKKVRDLTFELVDKSKILQEYRLSAEPTGTWEDAWLNSISLGRPFRVYDDAGVRSSTSYGLYVTRNLSRAHARNGASKGLRWDVQIAARGAP